MTQFTLNKENITARIERIVSELMPQIYLFEEKLNQAEMVEDLFNLVEKNLTFENFNELSDQELTKRFRGVMVTHAVSGMLNDLTPEEMAIFDESIRRK